MLKTKGPRVARLIGPEGAPCSHDLAMGTYCNNINQMRIVSAESSTSYTVGITVHRPRLRSQSTQFYDLLQLSQILHVMLR